MQRVEIITGKERRRRWSAEEKARLVAKAFESGAVVAHVARQYGVAESCLYAWRRQMAGRLPYGEARPVLIPVSSEALAPPQPDAEPPPAARSAPPGGAVVTFCDGTRLEIGADYPVAALKALVAAVQGQR